MQPSHNDKLKKTFVAWGCSTGWWSQYIVLFFLLSGAIAHMVSFNTGPPPVNQGPQHKNYGP